ncbi:isochorismatase family protein [Sporosarcina saromensis]|uniref:Isochorismatase family protein n=1 Tax=Sporosarcina saromensis TaxID=359365 RepID=A0ABU4GE28_9BACL|nr:isochorismatase family protein [Sporosarcina saromensis]MDW0115243.1 isochorismatase family protein [Sporosarcina saromensis]
MEALLVIDVQNGIVEFADFQKELTVMKDVIEDFKRKGKPVIFIRHLDDEEESSLYKGSAGSELHASLKEYAECIVEKQTPSAFFETDLSSRLEKLDVDHVFIIGFNTEFCCQFTAIAAFDRGYKVTFIEDGTGTTNTAESYGMAGLDIKDFVGTVLHWSNVIEVLDYEEYIEVYK